MAKTNKIPVSLDDITEQTKGGLKNGELTVFMSERKPGLTEFQKQILESLEKVESCNRIISVNTTKNRQI